MTKLRTLTLALAALCLVLPADAKNDKTKVENYAHPTMIMGQTQKIMGSFGGTTYVVGGRIMKPKHEKLFIEGKDKVIVSSFANSVMDILKTRKDYVFDPKAPVLRSELAVILAEGFNVVQNPNYKVTYSDVQDDYWAKDWIYKALDKGLMIGYPSQVFKPDQPVTKAEVFATIAQIIDVKYQKNTTPKFAGKKIAYIPTWANNATNEVVASNILNHLRDRDKVVSSEYLSKEQTAFLISELRAAIFMKGSVNLDPNIEKNLKGHNPISLKIKLNDRITAKHSNVGEKFTATTIKDTTLEKQLFPAGSLVTGEVVAVSRPGYKNQGYVKVKFLNIKNGDAVLDFPAEISEVKAGAIKNPNVVARLLGAPFEGSARVVGVAGRTVGVTATNTANRVEEFGDYFAGTFTETLSGKPISGAKSFGNSICTIFKGAADTVWLALSGAYGVVYEIGDEIVYVVLPSATNQSSLNPNEELTIIF